MGDSSSNFYLSGGPSRIPHARQRANSDEHTIIPLLASLPCESQFHPYLSPSEHQQNIGVPFLHPCPDQGTTQLDSDILPRHLNDESHSAMAIAYPESSQRTTSHALSPYTSAASGFRDYASRDLATLHASQSFRRGSWPSHSQMGYTPWAQSPPRIARSPISEPPESTSDESYQDSDVDEVAQMSPMMNQFQAQSPRNVGLAPQRVYHAPPPQSSLLTFQLPETMLQHAQGGQMPHCPPDTSVSTDDASELTHRSPSLAISVPFLTPSRLQGPSMRLQNQGEKEIHTNQFCTPASGHDVPFPSSHGPKSTRTGDQRQSGFKQQKKSKMHQCDKCQKLFPRPSGLRTHMNTHSGAKPYKCVVANCDKSFAVRSNAKRHLRTHGINPSAPDMLSRPQYTVGFEEPVVMEVHDAGGQPSRYRWVPHNPSPHEHEWSHQGSLSSSDGVLHSGITFQASTSSASSTLSNRSDDDYDEFGSSRVVDVHRSQGDYRERETNPDELSGTYPFYGGDRSPRGWRNAPTDA